MAVPIDLSRFINAQRDVYATALAEIMNGKKRSHWMWYIFPQIKGLGHSETSAYYAIKNSAEAEAFLLHPVLGKRLEQICKALLALNSYNASQVFGSPDDMKLRSSMTLFASVNNASPVFQSVLDKFFNGSKDERTLQIISKI